MALIHPLYSNFLENKSVYSLNISYWSRLLRRVTNTKKMPIQESLLNTTFNNGNRFYDGNPIFDAIFDNKKGVRIIQEQPDSDELNISAWIGESEIQGQKIEELVINLELTKESQAIAKDLLTFWLVNDYSKQKMEQYIEFIEQKNNALELAA